MLAVTVLNYLSVQFMLQLTIKVKTEQGWRLAVSFLFQVFQFANCWNRKTMCNKNEKHGLWYFRWRSHKHLSVFVWHFEDYYMDLKHDALKVKLILMQDERIQRCWLIPLWKVICCNSSFGEVRAKRRKTKEWQFIKRQTMLGNLQCARLKGNQWYTQC